MSCLLLFGDWREKQDNRERPISPVLIFTRVSKFLASKNHQLIVFMRVILLLVVHFISSLQVKVYSKGWPWVKFSFYFLWWAEWLLWDYYEYWNNSYLIWPALLENRKLLSFYQKDSLKIHTLTNQYLSSDDENIFSLIQIRASFNLSTLTGHICRLDGLRFCKHMPPRCKIREVNFFLTYRS